jgi:hypothetical protein
MAKTKSVSASLTTGRKKLRTRKRTVKMRKATATPKRHPARPKAVLKGKRKKVARNVISAARLAIAYHEAGHAIVCLTRNIGFDSVTIVPKGTSLGACVHPSVLGFDTSSRTERRGIARDCILVSYAGIHAQSLVDPNPKPYLGSIDDKNAFGLSREYGVFPRRMSFVGDDNHLAFLERLRDEAGRLVGRYRVVIEVLAKALMDEKTMDEKRAREVVAQFL